ncbi:30S ribosome-binding factor RbfA [Guggenheimella bovis]
MKDTRLRKIAEEIKRIVSSVILNELKDPRLPQIISITSVDVKADLKTAIIYVSAIDKNIVDRSEMVDILNRAKGVFRKAIGDELKVFNTPEPKFVYDDSIEKGLEMDALLRKINQNE